MQGWRAAFTPSGMWRIVVPVVCLVAGLLFATSHEAARGQELRSPATADLADLVRTAEHQVDSEATTLRQLQAEAKVATDAAATDDTHVGQLKAEEAPLLLAAGRQAVSGPGLTVVLDDAPSAPDDPTVDPNQLVVHQSDLQAVVNALWAGGADAVSDRRPAAHRHQRGAVRREHPAAQRPGVLAAVPDRGHRAGRRNVDRAGSRPRA